MANYKLVTTPGDPIKVIGGSPSISVIKNCVYLPLVKGNFWEEADWGIYTADGDLVEAAALYDKPGMGLCGQSKKHCFNINEFDVAPKDRYFYIGNIIHHYGHFICSSMPRIWAANNFELQHTPLLGHGIGWPGHWLGQSYVKELFAASGIVESDFAHFERPTIIKELIVPYPAFVEKNLAYTEFYNWGRSVGNRMSKALGRQRQNGYVYLAKSDGSVPTDGLANETELMAELHKLGVDIFHPAKHSIPEQIATMRQAKCLIGQVSSAFHTTIFSEPEGPQQFIQIAMSEHLYSTNHALFDEITPSKSQYIYFEGQYIDRAGANPGFEIHDPVGAAKVLLNMALA